LQGKSAPALACSGRDAAHLASVAWPGSTCLGGFAPTLADPAFLALDQVFEPVAGDAGLEKEGKDVLVLDRLTGSVALNRASTASLLSASSARGS
jgi:hypothetical protein